MKNKITIILLTVTLAFACSAKASAQSVSINQKTFPNKIFRTEVSKWDRDRNGTLSAKEIKNIKKISMRTTAKNQNKTMNLAGIERLNHLTELRVENGYRIKNLKSKSLKKLTVDQYALSKLSVKGVPNLTAFSVIPKNELKDDEGYSPVKKPLVDFSDVKKLKTLHYDYEPSIHTIDNFNISQNYELRDVEIVAELTQIDIQKLKKLRKLNLYMTGEYTLDVSMLEKLESLTLLCSVGKVIFPQTGSLKKLDLEDLRGVDVSSQEQLTRLRLVNCQLVSDLSSNDKLREIEIDGALYYVTRNETLGPLNFKNKKNLQVLRLYYVNNQDLLLGESTKLEELELEDCKGISLQMPESSALRKIRLEEVDIPELSLLGCPNVKHIELYTSSGILPKVTAKSLHELEYVSLTGKPDNQGSSDYTLDSFDISKSSKIKTLFIHNLPAYKVKRKWFPKLKDTNLWNIKD